MNNWDRLPNRAYVELSPREKEIWKRAAKRCNMPLNDWIRAAVNLHIGSWEEYRYESEDK